MTLLSFFRDSWPLMTFNYLETGFLEKLTWRASFCCVIFQLLMKFKIWPFWLFSQFLTFHDLFWPKDYVFSNAHIKSFILTYSLSTFVKDWNLTFLGLFSWFLTFGDLLWPWDYYFWKAYVKSFILRYNWSTFEKD